MPGKFGVKLRRALVISALGKARDFLSQLGDAAFENDFCRVRQIPGGRRSRRFRRSARDGFGKSYRYLPLIICSLPIILLGDTGVTRGSDMDVTRASDGHVTRGW
jgi:hypothetical protein